MKVLVTIGCVLLASLLSRPSLVRAEVVEHTITGTLSDGSEIFGTFGIDSDAINLNDDLSAFGFFDLVNVNVSLVGTDFLFVSGSSSGFADSGFLFQGRGEQEIGFTFLSEDGGSNAFTDGLSFGPFVGDVNTAAPIQGDYVGQGFVDGNGGAAIVSASISIQGIPEPSGVATVALVLLIGFLRRCRRRISSPLNFGTLI